MADTGGTQSAQSSNRLPSKGVKMVADDSNGRRGRTRFHVALLGLTIAAVNCYAQTTFCIAIVEMVVPADLSVASAELTMSANPGAPSNSQDDSCPLELRYRDYYDSWRFQTNASSSSWNVSAAAKRSDSISTEDRFDWDASQQGLLLGAFAVGTAPLQVVGGRLAEMYGAKWVLLAGCIGTAITNLTIPLLARASFALLIANRVLMGVAQAGMEPGLMCLLADWLTPDETGFFISMLLFAICIGCFLGSLCSSSLLTLGYGWPSTYYLAGGLNLFVGLVWLVYASSWPSTSRLISDDELAYIEREQRIARRSALVDEASAISGLMEPEKRSPPAHQPQPQPPPSPPPYPSDLSRAMVEQSAQAPWTNILSTPSVWAFILCKISIRWCADVLSIMMPTYLANVLHLSIKLNGILNSASAALFAIFSFITGYLVNEILKERAGPLGMLNSIGKTNLRKLMQSFASFGSAITVFLMTRYDCNIVFSMSMLLVLSCCLVMGTGGELQIPYDMTSRYPGTLHGMACTLSVSGWLAPPLIGLILGDQPASRYRWSIVWQLTALINLLGGLVFVLFADASPRDFDRPPERNRSAATAEGHAHPSATLGYHNSACEVQASPKLAKHHQGNWRAPATSATADHSAAWRPHFDRELIRVRQLEESFVRPPYLREKRWRSSLSSQTIVFPYRPELKPTASSSSGRLLDELSAAPGDTDWARALWARVRGRRKRFRVGPAEDQSTLAGEQAHEQQQGQPASAGHHQLAPTCLMGPKTVTYL